MTGRAKVVMKKKRDDVDDDNLETEPGMGL